MLRSGGRDDGLRERPRLWGVAADNVSLDYALGRIGGWLQAAESPQMIVTVDALAALRSRSDERYSKIVLSAAMSLPDGAGLIWALRFLGFTVQEQISGVDFGGTFAGSRQATAGRYSSWEAGPASPWRRQGG